MRNMLHVSSSAIRPGAAGVFPEGGTMGRRAASFENLPNSMSQIEFERQSISETVKRRLTMIADNTGRRRDW